MLSTPVIKGIEIIGPYQVLEDLGPAPFGTAYFAVDSRSDRTVILKVIPPSRPGAGQEDTPWEILLRETQGLGRIYHPGISPLFDIAELDGELLVAFAPVAGRTLHELLVQGERPDRQLLVDWGIQLLDILGEAHAAGILHRHLNEEEVVVCPNRRLVLAGFGLTQLVFDPISTLPPEQLAGEPYTVRSDLYAVGSLLRRLAFAGALRSGGAVGGRDPLLKVLARATFADPAGRFASAAEMAEALRAAGRAGRPAAVPPVRPETAAKVVEPWPAASPAPARTPEPAPTPVEDDADGDRWRTLLLLAATVLLMLLVIATGWILIGESTTAGTGPEQTGDLPAASSLGIAKSSS